MKYIKHIIPLISLIFVVGCSNDPSKMPSHRLSQPGINLSYITPDGWYQRKLPGNSYLTVYSEMDNGIYPNIQIEKVDENTLSLDKFIKEQQSFLKDYTLIQKSEFITDSGKLGEKAEVTKKNDQNILLSMYHYYFVGREKVYIVTAICPQVTLAKYGNVFDSAIKTIEFE